MKKLILVILYFFVIFLIINTGRSPFLKLTTSDTLDPQPIFNSALAYFIGPKLTFQLPNDPLLAKSWGLVPQSEKSDLQAMEAWKWEQGSPRVVVAVIDTGVDYHHADLKANLWRNPGEVGSDSHGKNKETNGIDDDNNGFIDDVIGWDFAESDPHPFDTHGHGTHISGIIAAEGGNGIGSSGVAPRVSVMVLRYYNPYASGKDNLTNTIKAIHYAVKNGAHIINYSGGGAEYSEDEKEAIREASAKGILFVAAAGNEGNHTAEHPYYPASYRLPNIISVGSMTIAKEMSETSNYGIVDVAAPGEHIYSTLPNNQYGYMNGTSQATAFVTGIAALILSQNSAFSAAEIKKRILESVDIYPTLHGKVLTNGKVNAYRAVVLANKQPQLPIANSLPLAGAEIGIPQTLSSQFIDLSTAVLSKTW